MRTMSDNTSERHEVSTSSPPVFLASLSAADLEQIQKAFQTKFKLTCEEFMKKNEFCETLEAKIPKGTKEDFAGLFDLIDISRDGVISWDRFSNHLLLEFYEKEDQIKSSQIPQWQELKHVTNPHRSFICKIMRNRTSNPPGFCSVSRDGLLGIYTEQFEVKTTHQLQTNQEEIRSKDLWVTDTVLLPNINKIAFTTTSKELWIYDVSSKNDFVWQYKIYGLKFIPMCMYYWDNPNNTNQAVLTLGDTNGDVCALFFTSSNTALFNKPLKSENSQEICFPIHIDEVIAEKFQSVSCIRYHAHEAWVRHIYFAPVLDCFISCSTTSTDSVVLAWLGKSRKDVRLTKFRITLGVNAFDHNEKMNLIATAGIDHHVCLWNPYVVSKPVGILRGHMQAIISVQFVHAKNQLLSLSKDKVLRIWDINLQICLQRLTGVFPKGIDMNIFMFYDQERASLLASFNYQMILLKMKSEVNDRVVSHDAPVMDIVYNEDFDQIISVCEASCINVWFLSTGQKVKQIANAHGDAEITAVQLDHSKTRILTAGTDGLIKIWDVNGHCHHELLVEEGSPCEISQVMCLKRMILAMGWSKVLCYFPTNQMRNYQVHPVHWKGKRQHNADILVADFIEPRTLVTASYDGEIVLWNTSTQQSSRKIVCSNQQQGRNTALPPLSVSPTPKTLSQLSIPSSPPKRTPSAERPSKPTNKPTLGRERSRSLRSRKIESQLLSSVVNDSSISQRLVAATAIGFLKQRNSHDVNTADLYSCHSDGVVRFWNSLTCEKICEFEAFDTFGAIVSCTDANNTYIGVGGENGHCKVYNISDYALNTSNDLTVVKNSEPEGPSLEASFRPHVDALTRIIFIERSGVLMILTSSCDCSVSIHCFDQFVGVFGQKEHWNINDCNLKNFRRFSKSFEKIEISYPNDEDNEEEDSMLPVKDTSQNVTDSEITIPLGNVDGEVETWNETLLGKAYQEERRTKRGRKQPYPLHEIRTTIPNDKQTRSYRCLETKYINEMELPVNKPDFVTHPEKYFLEKDDNMNFIGKSISSTPDTLQLRHDEKSIFPKYILDMETKMKAAHKIASNNRSTTVFSRLSVQSRPGNARSKKTSVVKSPKWRELAEYTTDTNVIPEL